ncbi:GPP34 family phosphoprotein [Rhodococcus sp. G-MC3]|uniref:GOLPH3/VPS74 family protein n=1 Tax=Rhodococcus sp. G-MC3 TaxID=3046209 RepID=UPI0024BB1111|nr:GPP34 family phosphoprotein [Rhodococcus sp. G-MC3]MDJ0393220.1 GPP34 family phosphoprotein [Rhodococcus sp. G-MC3]
MTLIAEDLLLVLLDEQTGKPIVDSTKLPRVLAGALVLELAMNGSVRIGDENRVVVAGPPPADPLLARAHELVSSARSPLKPQKIIEKLYKKLDNEVASRLVRQGFVAEEQRKMLGLFPATSWPAKDPARRRAAIAWIGSAVVDGTTPQPEISALIALLSAIDAIPKVLPGVDKKAAKKRAKEIAEGEWASEAVRKAVQDVNAAVMAALMVPVIVTAGSS